jgi:hypothetical protein
VRTFLCFALYSLACLLCGEAAAQAIHGGICRPVSERDREVGCWILSNDPIGEIIESQIFWHLDSFATLEAAEAAKGRRGTVLQALGKVWLLTIEDADWHASGGQHISTIGPLPITPGAYAVQYMEAVFTPGMTAILIQVLKPGTRLPAKHASKHPMAYKSAGLVALRSLCRVGHRCI